LEEKVPSCPTARARALRTLGTDHVRQLAETRRNKKAGEEKNNYILVAEQNISG